MLNVLPPVESPRVGDVAFLPMRGLFGTKLVAHLVTDVVGGRVYISAGGPISLLCDRPPELWRPRNLSQEERQQVVASGLKSSNPVGVGYQHSTIPPFMGNPVFSHKELHRVITTCGFFDKVPY